MSIPSFDPQTGYLPDGEHPCTFTEVIERFGWTARRRALLDGLGDALASLEAHGCRTVWLDGSFVTDQDDPDDFDLVWEFVGVDMDELFVAERAFFEFGDHRKAQRERFRGDLFPNVDEPVSGLSYVEFFKADRQGTRKGILVIDLTGGTP